MQNEFGFSRWPARSRVATQALKPVLLAARTRYNPRVRERLEYAAVWALLKTIGAMPRPLARFVGARTAALLFWMRPSLRAAAAQNLKIAFPQWSKKQRRAAIRGMVRQLGW